MNFKKGVYENLSFDEYNSIPAYRASDLKEANRCMFTWKNKKEMVAGRQIATYHFFGASQL